MSNRKHFKLVYAYHPGETLREKLQEMEMSVKEFAIRTTKPEKTINAVLIGESAVTPDMSIAFEQITRIPAHFWLNLQRNFDEYVARQKREAICQDAQTIEWAKRFPYAAMANLGWVEKTRILSEKIMNLLSFFRITSVKAWEDYFMNQALKSAFKISLSSTKDPYAISAWLRQGEIQAAEGKTKNPYSEAALKGIMPKIFSFVKDQPDDFALQLSNLCSEAGVKILYTAHIPHAPINGCTRWIDNVPCIQMTDKQKRNDVFWFSFFHEIGHILLHGKKDVFLEDAEHRETLKQKEEEADRFAAEQLLSQNAENEIVRELDGAQPTKQFIVDQANRYQTHPAIIVGRLQHNGIIRQDSALNSFKVPVNLF